MLEPRVAATQWKARLQLPFYWIRQKRTPSFLAELNNPVQKRLNASTKQKVYMLLLHKCLSEFCYLISPFLNIFLFLRRELKTDIKLHRGVLAACQACPLSPFSWCVIELNQIWTFHSRAWTLDRYCIHLDIVTTEIVSWESFGCDCMHMEGLRNLRGLLDLLMCERPTVHLISRLLNFASNLL